MKTIDTKSFFTTLFAALAMLAFTACESTGETATKESEPGLPSTAP